MLVPRAGDRPDPDIKRERYTGGMNFEVNIDERSDAYSVVVVRGEVDLHTAPKLQYAIERGAEGIETVIVDMGGIAFMDSTALSTFMRVREALEQKGGSLRLTTPSRAVQRIFDVTGFGDYFDVYPSREAAIPNGESPRE